MNSNLASCQLVFVITSNYKISLLGFSFFKTAQDVVDVIDNVMKMKKEDLQESQRSDKASTK